LSYPCGLMSSWAFVLGDSVLGDFVLGAFVLHSCAAVMCYRVEMSFHNGAKC